MSAAARACMASVALLAAGLLLWLLLASERGRGKALDSPDATTKTAPSGTKQRRRSVAVRTRRASDEKTARVDRREGVRALDWASLEERRILPAGARRSAYEGKTVGQLALRVVGPDRKPLHAAFGLFLRSGWDRRSLLRPGLLEFKSHTPRGMRGWTSDLGIAVIPVMYLGEFDRPGAEMQLITHNEFGYADRTIKLGYDQLFGWQRKIEIRLEPARTIIVRLTGVALAYRKKRRVHARAYEIVSEEPYESRSLTPRYPLLSIEGTFTIPGASGSLPVDIRIFDNGGSYEVDKEKLHPAIRHPTRITTRIRVRPPLPREIIVPMKFIPGKGELVVTIGPWTEGTRRLPYSSPLFNITTVKRAAKTHPRDDWNALVVSEAPMRSNKAGFALWPGRYVLLLTHSWESMIGRSEPLHYASVRASVADREESRAAFPPHERLPQGVAIVLRAGGNVSPGGVSVQLHAPVPDPFRWVHYRTLGVGRGADGTYRLGGLPPGGRLIVRAQDSRFSLQHIAGLAPVEVELPDTPGAVVERTLVFVRRPG